MAWTVPTGRSLSPADIGLIRQALADASAWRAWRAEVAGCEDCAQLDPVAAFATPATSRDCRVRRAAAASRRVGRRGDAVSRPARPEPGVVEVRLSGAAEDPGTEMLVLERLAAALPVTTIALEILHR